MPRGLSKNKQPHKEKTRLSMTGPTPEAKSDRQISAEPIHWSRIETLCAGIVFLTALLLYNCTLALQSL